MRDLFEKPKKREFSFQDLRAMNVRRCTSPAPAGFGQKLDSWSMSDWFLAIMGEFGEAANIAKKLNRIRDGIEEPTPEDELRTGLEEELADAQIYLDLLAASAGIDLGHAVIDKFNKTSKKRALSFYFDAEEFN